MKRLVLTPILLLPLTLAACQTVRNAVRDHHPVVEFSIQRIDQTCNAIFSIPWVHSVPVKVPNFLCDLPFVSEIRFWARFNLDSMRFDSVALGFPTQLGPVPPAETGEPAIEK